MCVVRFDERGVCEKQDVPIRGFFFLGIFDLRWVPLAALAGRGASLFSGVK